MNKKGKDEMKNFIRPSFPKGKKGSSIIMVIIEILVVILVIVMLTEVASGMGKSETVVKNNLANDLQLMIHTLVGVPGDVVVEYPENVSKYVFVLEQEKLSVFQKGDSKNKKVERKFDLPEGYISNGAIEQKARLCLEKTGKAILLRECEDEE